MPRCARPATYYYGNDDRATDMTRFFAAANREDITLNAQETRLRALLEQERMLRPGAIGALISIPPEVATPPIDAASCATILRHELSHGIYFTDPAYAACRMPAEGRTTDRRAMTGGGQRS